ncbi:MAG: hypothetical protein N4A71_26960 [Carboxylicivirga sp.]|jgi:hypothetical protein|nr:hypothetical protein [Carboxylicivirga sp.]
MMKTNFPALRMMKHLRLLFLFALIVLAGLPAVANNDESIGLPGDNLDLYAVLNLFQESKTIEEFEANLNKEETGINNLDLDLDGNVDFIKVETQQEGEDFVFVLQVDVTKEEVQDVAVILVSKDEKENVSLQMVGDEALYGKDYVIEPMTEKPAVTANPAYSGPDTIVVKSQPAEVVVIESEPIVHYIYSPMYVPYHPPYYYGYYPVYYRPYPVISINIYFGRHRHHHHHYHGGRRGGNTIIINNNKTYNNYNINRNTSNTVISNKKEGSYKKNTVAKTPAKTNPKATKANSQKAKSSAKENASKSSAKSKAASSVNKTKAKPAAKPAKKPQKRPAKKPTRK